MIPLLVVAIWVKLLPPGILLVVELHLLTLGTRLLILRSRWLLILSQGLVLGLVKGAEGIGQPIDGIDLAVGMGHWLAEGEGFDDKELGDHEFGCVVFILCRRGVTCSSRSCLSSCKKKVSSIAVLV